MRLSSPQLAAAVIQGITDQGVNAIDLGLTTTDELYFAVGKFDYPAGVMITASHNPGKYNGMKFCRAQAFPISLESGLVDIRDLAIAGMFVEPERKGQIIQRDVLDDFVQHALSFIDVSKIKPLKVVIDAGNGMAGPASARATCASTPCFQCRRATCQLPRPSSTASITVAITPGHSSRRSPSLTTPSRSPGGGTATPPALPSPAASTARRGGS